MTEKLISDNELNKIIKDFEAQFNVGIIKDYKSLKSKGEKFLEAAYSINSKGMFGRLKAWIDNAKNKENRKSLSELFFDDARYRIFLGIGVELIVKAAFVKEGYAINSYKDFKKMKGKPEKLSSIKESDLSIEKTHNISFLIKHMNLVFPANLLSNDEFNTYIRKGLEIARVWRNKEVHISSGYHTETAMEDAAIKTALYNIYDNIFKEIETIQNILKTKSQAK